jgi:DNA-binding NarL/FixJ family response regulator
MAKMKSSHYLPPMITVGIVEDDREVREALQSYCDAQEGFSCELAEESAETFLARLTPRTVPDVILMDISAIRVIKDRYPDVSIIMLTVYMDSHKVFQSLCAGASGYLLKTAPFAEVKEAIEVAYAGGAPMSPPIGRKVIDFFHHGPHQDDRPVLTMREREIVMGLVDGLSYKMIADRANVAIETVRSHIKNIYLKLHIHSKAEVIAKTLKGEI